MHDLAVEYTRRRVMNDYSKQLDEADINFIQARTVNYTGLRFFFTCFCSNGKRVDWSPFSRSLDLITCVMGPCRSIFVPG